MSDAPKKRGPKPKIRNAAKEFAVLYSNGALAGNWAACEEAVGQKFDIAEVRDYIVGEGGLLPDTMPTAPIAKARAETAGFEGFSTASVLTDMNKAQTQDDWLKIAKQMESTVLGIMDGSIKGSAAQTSLIKTVWDRAYGKTAAKEQEKVQAAGVIILPTLGERSNMTICPRCRYEMEQKYPKEEVKNAEA